MRRIEIDDEVYAVLEQNVRGFEQPNDVLRRLLLASGPAGEGSTPTPNSSAAVIPGALAPLLAAGVVRAGDTLSHVQVRKARSFSAVIEADGWIRTEKGRYKEPSPALGELVGTAIDGWARWKHDETMKSLRQLRSEIGGSGRFGRYAYTARGA